LGGRIDQVTASARAVTIVAPVIMRSRIVSGRRDGRSVATDARLGAFEVSSFTGRARRMMWERR